MYTASIVIVAFMIAQKNKRKKNFLSMEKNIFVTPLPPLFPHETVKKDAIKFAQRQESARRGRWIGSISLSENEKPEFICRA